MKHRPLMALLLGVILTLSLLPALAPAGSEASPLALPPRPEDVKGDGDEDDDDEQPVGAHIVLHVSSAPAGVWTIVQWQDTAGGWHDVESWSGALDDGSHKTWWLAPDLFGKGPFRWLVYQGERGKLVATSDSFYLPEAEGEKLWVEVSF
jgi:hypothetical protein